MNPPPAGRDGRLVLMAPEVDVRTLKEIRSDLTAARERRDTIRNDLEQLHESAGGEELRDGQAIRWENLTKGLTKAEGDVERFEDELRDDLAEGARSGRYGTEEAVPAGEDRERRPDDRGDPQLGRVRDAALAANDRASFLPENSRAHMERTIRGDDDPQGLMSRYVVEAGSRDYYRAFSSWVNDPISGGHEWSPAEREAVKRVRALERAMAIGTGGAGGFLVPYELDPSILIANAGAISPLRQLARVATTAYNEKRFVTSLGVTATWTPEATEQTDDSPALLQPAITCKKGMAFVPVSFELFEDSDIAAQIGEVFADAKNVHEALSFTLTQSNGPTGIISSLVASGGSTVIATGTNVLAQGDLYANQAALPARWRGNAAWMMNLSILNGYRQLPQATGLNYSVIDDSGPVPKALGWPVYENSSMDGTLTGSAADYLVLSGDFRQFAIVDRVGTTIEVIPQLFGTTHRPTGQRGFLMHYRSGSDVLIPDAFRLSNFST
jgi:HK97 family phage major capsid protein